MAEIFITLIYN